MSSGGVDNVSIADPDTMLNVEKKIGSRPNTGTIAIYDILSKEPETLYVGGLSFHRSQHVQGYANYIPDAKLATALAAGQHIPEAQLAYFKKDSRRVRRRAASGSIH